MNDCDASGIAVPEPMQIHHSEIVVFGRAVTQNIKQDNLIGSSRWTGDTSEAVSALALRTPQEMRSEYVVAPSHDAPRAWILD